MPEKRNVSVLNKPTAGLPGWCMIRFSVLALLLALTLTFAAGCNRNKNRQVPPQATVPLIAVPPTAQAGQHPAPPVQTTPPPATSAQTGAIRQPSASRAKPKPQKNSVRTSVPATAKQTPPVQAVQPAQPVQPAPQKPPSGSEVQVQIAAQAPQGTAQNTEQLLQAAEGNLRKVTRQLSDGEEAMLRQARNYIAQSRSASQDGDLERAYNLAMKASLLSGELAK
jgi:outer membrane biosynthesis protein TonB